ncbi:MAG TPA: UbiA family prenyltransferase [Dehalococcoidia bacterium]|nr:UbiA family prenyltransferase [Dehalococcoidia bacterium]
MSSESLPLAYTGRSRAHAGLRVARVIHPFPTLLTVLATLGLSFVAARGEPGVAVLVRMLVVMFLAQSAIGVANDYFDRDLDAQTKPWKPIASGLIPTRTGVLLAVALSAATVALGATLGLAPLLLVLAGLACGLAYDAGLKRTPFSALPYMVAIPVLPLFVWVTLGQWQPVLWWLLPLGGLIGLALHLQNTLGDIDDDARFGVRGLAHRLGVHRSMALGWAAFAAALAISVALAPFVGYELRWYLPAAAVGGACLAASVGLYVVRRSAMMAQVGFGLLGIGAAVLATGWLAAVTR